MAMREPTQKNAARAAVLAACKVIADDLRAIKMASGRPRSTRGRFGGWSKGGPLNAWGARFYTRSTVLWVPEYLLSRETKEALLDEEAKLCPSCNYGDGPRCRTCQAQYRTYQREA